MTMRIAGMVRLGLTPEINALAVIFIGLTIVAAVAFELKRRAEKRREAVLKEIAKREDAAIASEKAEPIMGKAQDIAA
jgi:spermidine/putrescine transport system permease protein